MSYTNHLNSIILKSTFQINSDICDGFIDQFGTIISCDSHHHVEKALEIIANMDNSRKRFSNIKNYSKNKIEIIKDCIQLLNEDKIVDSIKLFNKKIFEFSVNENLDKNQLQINYLNTLDIFQKDIEFCNEVLNKESEISKFEKANKNKGYDAAEYLIINFNYIAIENKYLLYHNVKLQQVINIGCFVEKDKYDKQIIGKLSDIEIKQLTENKRKKLLSEASWYKESENRFHCPSGFTRISYNRWRNECFKYGLNPDELIYK